MAPKSVLLSTVLTLAFLSGCVTSGEAVIELHDAPEELPAGAQVNLTWRFPNHAPKDVTHSELHVGASPERLEDRSEGRLVRGDPDDECTEQQFCLPAEPTQFRAELPGMDMDVMYLVVHAIVSGEHVETPMHEVRFVSS